MLLTKRGIDNLSTECTASAEMGAWRTSLPGSLDGAIPTAPYAQGNYPGEAELRPCSQCQWRNHQECRCPEGIEPACPGWGDDPWGHQGAGLVGSRGGVHPHRVRGQQQEWHHADQGLEGPGQPSEEAIFVYQNSIALECKFYDTVTSTIYALFLILYVFNLITDAIYLGSDLQKDITAREFSII